MKSKMALLANGLLLIFSNSLHCSTGQNYLTKTLPVIKERLQFNADDLISQKRSINLVEKTLDILQQDNQINIDEVKAIKEDLDAIFEQNLAKASYQERAMYQIQRPLQFVYSKLTDPNASYLERFVYGTAVAAGVAITGYGIYRGGQYVTSQWYGDQTANPQAKRREEIKEIMKQEAAYNKLIEEKKQLTSKRESLNAQQKKLQEESQQIKTQLGRLVQEDVALEEKYKKQQEEINTRIEAHNSQMKKLEKEIEQGKKRKERYDKELQEIKKVQSGEIPYQSPDLVDPQNLTTLQKRYDDIKKQEFVMIEGHSVRNPNFNEEDLRVAKKQLEKAQFAEKAKQMLGAQSSPEDIEAIRQIRKNREKIQKLMWELQIGSLEYNYRSESPSGQLEDTKEALKELQNMAAERKKDILINPSDYVKVTITLSQKPTNQEPQPEEQAWHKKNMVSNNW